LSPTGSIAPRFDVLERPIDEALAMNRRGEIVDGKTIMWLQYAALSLFG